MCAYMSMHVRFVPKGEKAAQVYVCVCVCLCVGRFTPALEVVEARLLESITTAIQGVNKLPGLRVRR